MMIDYIRKNNTFHNRKEISFMEKLKKILKFGFPVLFAGALSMVQAWQDQKEQQRIDDMENRINSLEEKQKINES